MRDDLARCKFCGLTYHFSDDHTCIKQLESFREIDQAIISTLQAKVQEQARVIEEATVLIRRLTGTTNTDLGVAVREGRIFLEAKDGCDEQR